MMMLCRWSLLIIVIAHTKHVPPHPMNSNRQAQKEECPSVGSRQEFCHGLFGDFLPQFLVAVVASSNVRVVGLANCGVDRAGLASASHPLPGFQLAVAPPPRLDGPVGIFFRLPHFVALVFAGFVANGNNPSRLVGGFAPFQKEIL